MSLEQFDATDRENFASIKKDMDDDTAYTAINELCSYICAGTDGGVVRPVFHDINCESGFSRYDIKLELLRENNDEIIIEFKVHDRDDEKTLSDIVAAALRQIEATGIRAESIRKYGFAFQGKECLIG